MDYDALLQKAIGNLDSVPQNSVFCAKDLFQGTEWNELQKGERLSFGRCFKNAVMDGKVPGVAYMGKADNNSAQYKRQNGDIRKDDGQ